MAKRFNPGDRIQYTAEFLRNTGQITGDAPNWSATVVECPCPMCKHPEYVATDTLKDPAELRRYFSPEDLRDMPHLKYLHVAVCNIKRISDRELP